MRKDSPAVFECKASAGGLHRWARLPDYTAKCENCKIVLNKADADDVFRD